MAKIVQMRDSVTGEEEFPRTLPSAVVDENGKNVTDHLNEKANSADVETISREVSNKADKIKVINQNATTATINPNTLNKWAEVAELNISFGTPTETNTQQRYIVQFTSGATATKLTLPKDVVWGDGCGVLEVEASKSYELDFRYTTIGSVAKYLGLWEGYTL